MEILNIDNFISNGSLISFFIMWYAANVMIDVSTLQENDRFGFYTPDILKTPLSGLLRLGALPLIFWPWIYIGLFDGVVVAFVAWVLFQLLSVILTLVLQINNHKIIGYHFILACILYPIGYYLSLTNLPNNLLIN
jgi:hypothetical protein